MDHDYIFLLSKINGLNDFILIVGVAEWCWFHFRGRHMEQDPLEILSLAS